MVLHGFVMEDGEVEGKSELDRIAGREFDAVGFIVSSKGLLFNLIEVITLGVLGDVTVVISNHLDEEGLRLSVTRLSKDLVVNHINDSLAIFLQFLLNSSLVVGEGIVELLVVRVLLNSGNGSASSSLGRNEILECN